MRYSYTHEPLDDLVQVASVGLLKALERFQPDRGNKFTSFATPTILGELKRHFRDKGWALHVPRDIQERALALSRETERLGGKLGRTPSLRELAEAMHCRVDDVLEATMALRSYDTASLDAPAASEDQESASLGDLLPSHEPGYELAENREVMADRWRSLSDLERKVVELRVVHDMTQREIGRRIGYSQMHVSRLLRRSLKRLDVTAGIG
jgi:RNA polymerase sigma-B factor